MNTLNKNNIGATYMNHRYVYDLWISGAITEEGTGPSINIEYYEKPYKFPRYYFKSLSGETFFYTCGKNYLNDNKLKLAKQLLSYFGI